MNGNKLKALRELAGDTQLSLAVAVGTTPNTIAGFEQGRVENPRIGTLKEIARRYGVTVDELLSD